MQERYIFDLRSETPTEIQAVVLQAENLELVAAWYEDGCSSHALLSIATTWIFRNHCVSWNYLATPRFTDSHTHIHTTPNYTCYIYIYVYIYIYLYTILTKSDDHPSGVHDMLGNPWKHHFSN